MAIDAVVGSATMNSYVTIAEATTYFAQRLNASAWSANASKQEAALVTARRRMDAEWYIGQRVLATQTCAFPRKDDTDPVTGEDLDPTTVPQGIKDGQCELALALLVATDDLLADSGMEPFSQVSIGPLSVTLRDNVMAGDLPNEVLRHVSAYLLSSGGTFRLVRA